MGTEPNKGCCGCVIWTVMKDEQHQNEGKVQQDAEHHHCKDECARRTRAMDMRRREGNTSMSAQRGHQENLHFTLLCFFMLFGAFGAF